MNKIVSIKNTSAIFLAIVLIAGTIALSPTFFMVGTAQASSNDEKDYDKYDKKSSYEKDNYKSTEYPSYEKDNSYDKSKDSSNVIIKKIKCNNINVNLNGFNGIEVNALPPALNGLATDDEAQAADEGEIGASFSGSGERNTNGYQHNDKDFRFVCINNNDFVVVEEEEEPPTCEECFTENLDEQQIIELKRVLALTDLTPTLEAFCDLLSNPNVPNEAKLLVLGGAFVGANIDNELSIIIAECLEDLGIIELPSPPT